MGDIGERWSRKWEEGRQRHGGIRVWLSVNPSSMTGVPYGGSEWAEIRETRAGSLRVLYMKEVGISPLRRHLATSGDNFTVTTWRAVLVAPCE